MEVFGFSGTRYGDSETFDKKKAAVCCLCKVVSPHSVNTTNFATHLEHHHPVEYSSFPKSGRTSDSDSGSTSSASLSDTKGDRGR